MSNRRKLRTVQEPGVKQEVRDKRGAPLPTPPAPGEHIWIVTGCWHVTDPTAERFELDRESLITVDGPGCLICEQIHTPELAARPCPGEPRHG